MIQNNVHDEVYPVCVIGAGLAGSECVAALLKYNVRVLWLEMRPQYTTPAHHTHQKAELVCSNSFRSQDVMNAVGLIKEEMSALGSVVMRAAYKAQVPAGSALAVDRDLFSEEVEAHFKEVQNLIQKSALVTHLEFNEKGFWDIQTNDEIIFKAHHVVVASGPLTAKDLSDCLQKFVGENTLYFYDAIAPIIEKDSIDLSVAFWQSRYEDSNGSGGDYINCPMNQEQYESFVHNLIHAEKAEVKDFDKAQFFEGCLPIEVMAERGLQTLSYGPLKPVGLTNPHKPNEAPYAVVQLRQDNRHATLFNMVGFQTRMKQGPQREIFRKIPGLEKAEFVRLGSMHRNTYLCSPLLLGEGLSLKSHSGLHFAGQITGCEGYVESAAVGLFVGHYLAHRLTKNRVLPLPPQTSALGALLHHILHGDPEHYQPMNVNFGLMPELVPFKSKKDRKVQLVQRAVKDFRVWYYQNGF